METLEEGDGQALDSEKNMGILTTLAVHDIVSIRMLIKKEAVTT
jgi:hypothetical protein